MRIRAVLGLAASLVLWSCAQSPRAADSAVPALPPAAAAPAAPPVEDRLNSPAFRTLPAEARSYLERLSRAFSARDEAFLLAQGEAQFEAEVRPRYDKEAYLALLYRTGSYAAESPRASAEVPRLVPSGLSHIQYLSWEENGPLLEIAARLVGKNGASTPCLIMLAWRLREPKIQGLFP